MHLNFSVLSLFKFVQVKTKMMSMTTDSKTKQHESAKETTKKKWDLFWDDNTLFCSFTLVPLICEGICSSLLRCPLVVYPCHVLWLAQAVFVPVTPGLTLQTLSVRLVDEPSSETPLWHSWSTSSLILWIVKLLKLWNRHELLSRTLHKLRSGNWEDLLRLRWQEDLRLLVDRGLLCVCKLLKWSPGKTKLN